MNRPVYKRLFAYAIDMLIVAVIASLFLDIPIINPYFDKYIELSESMMQFIGGNETLTIDTINQLQYDFVYYSFYTSIIVIVVKIIYFILFQYLNKGQTIGKAIFKIQIVSDKRKLKFYQVLLSSLIVCNIATSAITLTVLRLLSMDSYLKVSGIINYIELIIIVAIVIMINMRKDQRGLHDLLSKTKVVYVEKEN